MYCTNGGSNRKFNLTHSLNNHGVISPEDTRRNNLNRNCKRGAVPDAICGVFGRNSAHHRKAIVICTSRTGGITRVITGNRLPTKDTFRIDSRRRGCRNLKRCGVRPEGRAASAIGPASGCCGS